MNKTFLIAGSSFVLSGSLLFGMVYLAIANYAPHMTGWSDPPGKFSLAMEATMTKAPFLISILFMVIGSLMLAIAVYKELRLLV